MTLNTTAELLLTQTDQSNLAPPDANTFLQIESMHSFHEQKKNSKDFLWWMVVVSEYGKRKGEVGIASECRGNNSHYFPWC